MTRFCLFVLLSLLAGCHRSPELQSDGLGPDLDVGETITVDLYDLHQGFETQGFDCDDGDGVTASDPSLLLVTFVGREEVVVNGYRPSAMKFALTGLEPGSLYLHLVCNGDESDIAIRVR